MDVFCAIHHISDFCWLWIGLNFGFPYLGLRMEQNYFFLWMSSEMLTSSLLLLNMKHVFTLRLLSAEVPSLSHLLKFDRLRRALPLFQERPFSSSAWSLDLIVDEGK